MRPPRIERGPFASRSVARALPLAATELNACMPALPRAVPEPNGSRMHARSRTDRLIRELKAGHAIHTLCSNALLARLLPAPAPAPP